MYQLAVFNHYLSQVMSRLVLTIRNSTLVTGWLKLELWSIISSIVQMLIDLVCYRPLATSIGPEMSRMRKANAYTGHACRRDFYFLSPLIINKVMSHSICPWHLLHPRLGWALQRLVIPCLADIMELSHQGILELTLF